MLKNTAYYAIIVDNMDKQLTKKVIGRAEPISFPEIGLDGLPARIDTGAKTSAIWVSSAKVVDGKLQVVFLGKEHPAFSGQVYIFDEYASVIVASSNGQSEKRFKVRLLTKLAGKNIRATFTLADRSSQVYPVLVGRNVLHGKFIVDVKKGKPLTAREKSRSQALQSQLKET